MNLKNYTLEDIILTALKSEIDSKNFYSKLSNQVENFLLKDRLVFLANEEAKHQNFFESLYGEHFPDKSIVLPKKNIVPLPELKLETEPIAISKVLQSAMDAEKSAHDFYLSFAELFGNKPDIRHMILYIASMELGHYRLLEIEKENAEKFEGYNIDFPLMHIGP
ncbi:MAG: ferritin family protein [candidate division WOR-3 bacterium]|nr:ferritin family protein [candidate division WOR-3 bacterium]